jgi:hypothetical protein
MNVVCSGAITLICAPDLLHSRDHRKIKRIARSAQNALCRLPDLSQIIDNLGPACAATELILCTFPVCERKTELGQDKIGGAYACEAPRAMGRLIASEKRYWTVGPMIFAAENSAQSAHVGSRRVWGGDLPRSTF